MELLCITTLAADFIGGYIALDDDYARFTLEPGKPAVIHQHARFPKSDYRDYEHFAGVVGKFDSYAFLLRQPIPIPALDFEFLSDLCRKNPTLRTR